MLNLKVSYHFWVKTNISSEKQSCEKDLLHTIDCPYFWLEAMFRRLICKKKKKKCNVCTLIKGKKKGTASLVKRNWEAYIQLFYYPMFLIKDLQQTSCSAFSRPIVMGSARSAHLWTRLRSLHEKPPSSLAQNTWGKGLE